MDSSHIHQQFNHQKVWTSIFTERLGANHIEWLRGHFILLSATPIHNMFAGASSLPCKMVVSWWGGRHSISYYTVNLQHLLIDISTIALRAVLAHCGAGMVWPYGCQFTKTVKHHHRLAIEWAPSSGRGGLLLWHFTKVVVSITHFMMCLGAFCGAGPSHFIFWWKSGTSFSSLMVHRLRRSLSEGLR